MVKNELSIKSQQSYKVSLKIAEHEIEKIKKNTSLEIAKYKGLINFKNASQEAEIFKTQKEILRENVDSLFLKCSYASQAIYYKNIYRLKKLEFSYITINKNDPYKEELKKTVAKNRSVLTKHENDYLKSQFNAEWYEREQESHLQFRLEYDKLVQQVYGDQPHLESLSYQEFYENVHQEYQSLKENAQKVMESFYPFVEQDIETAYAITFAKEIKDEIVSFTQSIVNNLNEIEQISIDNIYKNIDLKILKEQEKEGLDIHDEYHETETIIQNNEKKKEELLNEITKLDALLHQSLKENENRKNNTPIDCKHSNLDEKQVELLQKIVESFRLSYLETFNNIFNILKEYILQLCPFYYEFISQKESEYESQNVEYRLKTSEQLAEDIKKLYLKDSDQYINYLANIGNQKQIVDEINENHQKSVADIKAQYESNKSQLNEDLKARKEDYSERKKSAKLNLKVADASKASEIKDILKLYKKEIKEDIALQRSKIKDEFRRKLKEEKLEYDRKVFKATNSAPLVYKKDYLTKKAANKKIKDKESRLLTRKLNKEYKTSKYRKNFNTTARENRLGYIFISVWAIGFIIFTFLPILYTILMVFSESVWTSTNGYSTLIDFSFKTGLTFPSWTGTTNFETLFLKNITFAYTYVPRFFRSLLFYVPIVVFISFVLAMLLNSKIKGRTFFRIIYFLPVVIVSGPVLSMLNSNNSSGGSSIVLNLNGSSVAKILESMSPKALEYANEVFSNFIIILWMTGVPIVLFISALQKINRQLYEAAEIDGANKWQMLWTITFPLIKSVLLIICLFTIMQVTTINVAFVNPINDWLENQLNSVGANYGVIALAAWVQTIIVLLFVLVAFLLFREKEFISKDKNYEEIEEAKRKKEQKKAKMIETLHINEIKNFFAKVFAPITRVINTRKERKKQKREMEG